MRGIGKPAQRSSENRKSDRRRGVRPAERRQTTLAMRRHRGARISLSANRTPRLSDPT